METTAGNGDDGGIALQEGVLLYGAVESILRIDRIVALIESRGMVAEHPIGHGHFRGERLERIEPLIGVGDRALELLILLLEGFLVVAKSVVVADLPEHP